MIAKLEKFPKLSICMLSFNDERYIEQAINDILRQDYQNFELIISDDCSTDNSIKLINTLAHKDKRIRFFEQTKNLGMQANYEFTLAQAQGKFFIWASSDDRWDRKFASTLVKAIEKDDQLISVAAPFEFIDESGVYVKDINTSLKDYEGKYAFFRLIKFSIFYFDDFFYGIHRKSCTKGLKVPIWWGINKKIPANNNFPVLAFFLARGRYLRIKGKPLFFKRIHRSSSPRHSAIYSGHPFLGFFAPLIRKYNVLYETIKAVYIGSNSFILTIAVAPFFAIRCLVDCLVLILVRFKRLMA